MAMKKKVLEELQKFNDDLDKHLPELNLDYLKNKDIFAQGNQMDEVVPLLANNLMDLKTEVALIRKNLVDSVEGMVLRVISNQQQAFAGQMDRAFTQMMVEMKGNFASYIAEISSGMSTIKKDLNELKIENNKLSSKFEIFDSKMIELKSVIEDIKGIKSEVPMLISENIADVKNINSSLLSNVERELEKQDSKFSSLKVEIENIKNKEDNIRKELVGNFSKKFLEVSNRNVELERNLDKVAKGINSINGSLNKKPKEKVIIKEVPKIVEKIVEREIPQIIEKEVKVEVLKPRQKVVEKKTRKLKQVNLNSSENLSKLISIEDRIKKLDSLK